MPQVCSACRHRNREAIDAALLKNEPLRVIAERHGISKTAAWRHKNHISATLVKAGEAAELAHAGRLTEQLRGLVADAQRLKRSAERKRDLVTALRAIRELTRLCELAAKVSGQLDDRPQHNTLHVHLPADTALRIAETFVARHGGPKALLPSQVIDGNSEGG